MNENENNFEALRQLLKLKQHETPPPGYFNNFSSQVIARIRAGETKESPHETSWFWKFLQAFELKPAFAGAFASAVCLLLIFSIMYVDRPDAAEQPMLQNFGQSSGSLAALSPAALPPGMESMGITSSNNPSASLQPFGSPFGSGNSLIQPASFSTSGN